MLKTIHLHGYFSAFHNGPVKVVANTVADAIKIVTTQIPGFRPTLAHGRHQIVAAGFQKVEDLFRTLDDDETEIHLMPQFNGGKKGGFLQILLGAVLIGISFIPGVGPVLASVLLSAGIGMALGGLVQLMSPQPEVDTYAQEQVKSRYLGTPKNTVKIGTRIPIVYGRRKVYGHYLSFDIDAKEVA